ncbi:hypothetical protein ES705_41114 [subsurface metagenome]
MNIEVTKNLISWEVPHTISIFISVLGILEYTIRKIPENKDTIEMASLIRRKYGLFIPMSISSNIRKNDTIRVDNNVKKNQFVLLISNSSLK